MHFVWPQALWALLLAPLLLAFYLWLLRRKQRSALAYPSLALVSAAMDGNSKHVQRAAHARAQRHLYLRSSATCTQGRHRSGGTVNDGRIRQKRPRPRWLRGAPHRPHPRALPRECSVTAR